MSDIAIKVENLSKAYQLGDFGTGSLTSDIERWWALMRGKEDPFLKIGETNDRTAKGTSDIVWSLKDINFEIKEGDAVGIIGRNGAGKSTLLKLLSRVTSPSTGNIKVKGRIASLLEVGTGFHPELTGGENIYLNGAIMGMSKREIKKKFDEIVDFAGVERYIGTPVKRYSSGMYVRLAFAVAAHLESEILIVDEVLAVGDAEFQKKCLGKMGDVSKGEGRTVLFVSHNMGSIMQLCNRGILLKNGLLDMEDKISLITDRYITSQQTAKTFYEVLGDNIKAKDILFTKAYLGDASKSIKNDFNVFDYIYVYIDILTKSIQSGLKLSVTLQDKNGNYVSTFVEDLSVLNNKGPGSYSLAIKIDKELIAPNNYYLRLALFVHNGELFDLVEMICPFRIHDTGTDLSFAEGADYGNFLMKYKLESFEKNYQENL
jgi:lipopolysaccharide transport system ATP-binding protein